MYITNFIIFHSILTLYTKWLFSFSFVVASKRSSGFSRRLCDTAKWSQPKERMALQVLESINVNRSTWIEINLFNRSNSRLSAISVLQKKKYIFIYNVNCLSKSHLINVNIVHAVWGRKKIFFQFAASFQQTTSQACRHGKRSEVLHILYFHLIRPLQTLGHVTPTESKPPHCLYSNCDKAQQIIFNIISN